MGPGGLSEKVRACSQAAVRFSMRCCQKGTVPGGRYLLERSIDQDVKLHPSYAAMLFSIFLVSRVLLSEPCLLSGNGRLRMQIIRPGLPHETIIAASPGSRVCACIFFYVESSKPCKEKIGMSFKLAIQPCGEVGVESGCRYSQY